MDHPSPTVFTLLLRVCCSPLYLLRALRFLGLFVYRELLARSFARTYVWPLVRPLLWAVLLGDVWRQRHRFSWLFHLHTPARVGVVQLWWHLFEASPLFDALPAVGPGLSHVSTYTAQLVLSGARFCLVIAPVAAPLVWLGRLPTTPVSVRL